MSFSPKYGMIMADVAGDARNGKTPLRGVCGAQNAAAMAFRAAAAPSFRSVTKSARRRTYCTQYGARRRLARRFSARESGVPQLFTVCLPSRSPLPRFSLRLRRIRPPRGGRRCGRRAGVRRACRTRNGIAFCGSRHFPLAACLGRVRPSDRGDRVFAAGQPHFGRGRQPYRQRALTFLKRRICKTIGAWAI